MTTITLPIKSKGKFHPRTGHENSEGEQMSSSTLSLTPALGGVGDQGYDQVDLPPIKRNNIHCTGGWLGPIAVLDGCGKSLNHTGIQSPDHLARSQSLYQLRYPVPLTLPITGIFANSMLHLFFTTLLCPYRQCIALQLPFSFSGREYCNKHYDYDNLYLNQCCQVYLVMLFELKLYLTHAQSRVRAYEILRTNIQKYLHPFQTPRKNRTSYFRELNFL
jgi:hypothetical protein